MASTQSIPQEDFSTLLGIAPELLKKMRDHLLIPGEDWQPGRPILFHESGVKKIRAALKLPATPEALAPSAGVDTADSEKKGVAERVELTVVRLSKGTKGILFCKNKAGREVRLRVKDSTNFIPGMLAPRCVAVPTVPDLYDFEGRCPRWKGRY